MRRGFSMLELVIVVVIIAIIAAIAVPRMSSASQNSKFTATQASMVSFEKAMLLYQATYAAYAPAIRPGDRPSAVREFIKESDWETQPGLGGEWIWLNSPGGKVGVAINSPNVARPVLTAFDRLYDNGNIDTGLYQMVGTAYARLLESGVTVDLIDAEGAAAATVGN